MTPPTSATVQPTRLSMPAWVWIVGGLLLALGVAAFGGALATGQPMHAWGGWLIGMFYVLGLGIFGTLWVAIQHVTRAGWSVPMRRIPEAMSTWLLPSVVLAPLTVLGAHTLYHWSHHDVAEHDALIAHKSAFLNVPGFVGAVALTLVFYAVVGSLLNRWSTRQDTSGEVAITQRSVTLSAVFLLVFAPSVSVLSWYLLMSLTPHWFSTMFSVLVFTDIMQTGLAVVSLVVAVFVARGVMKGVLNENHLHDVTKMAYAFTGFWAYIYFCQYLLIWYPNIPEETSYFLARQQHGWLIWLLVLPVVKFVIPFIWLTPREAKRKPWSVIPMMALLLVGQFLELFVMVSPSLGHGHEGAHAFLPFWEIAISLGFLGAFMLVAGWAFSRHPALPIKDPYLGVGLKHHI
jgi:hypothetical protein